MTTSGLSGNGCVTSRKWGRRCSFLELEVGTALQEDASESYSGPRLADALCEPHVMSLAEVCPAQPICFLHANFRLFVLLINSGGILFHCPVVPAAVPGRRRSGAVAQSLSGGFPGVALVLLWPPVQESHGLTDRPLSLRWAFGALWRLWWLCALDAARNSKHQSIECSWALLDLFFYIVELSSIFFEISDEMRS